VTSTGDRTGRSSNPRAVLLVTVGTIAAIFYSNFFIDWILRGFDGMTAVVSNLSAAGEPNAALLRVTDVTCAALVVFLVPWVRAGLPSGTWRNVCAGATIVFALGAALAAIVPPPCGPGVVCGTSHQQAQAHLHDAMSVVSDTALFVGVVAAWFASRRPGPAWFRRIAWWEFWLGGVVSSVAFAYFDLTQDPAWAPGVSQRVHIVLISLWILTLAIFAASALPRPAQPPARRKADTR